ncbi:MAG: molybdopterin-binding protein [Peptococcaceae bacterium]|nr:molybdopterin-binding protein [Peptococcaceae bacterium]
MDKIRVQDAVGMKLCHDITKVIPGQFKGIAFRRGHVIRQEDVEELLNIGKEHIYIWEENAGEIHEDEAAIRIAKAVMGKNLSYEQPREGKTVLKSTVKGLFKVNRDMLRAINSIDKVTVSSRPDNYTVVQEDKLVGARVIPLVIEEEKINQIENICAGRGPVFEVKPYKKLKAGIMITGNEVFKGRIEDKFGPVIRKKLEYFDTEILDQIYCPDEPTQLNESIVSFIKRDADLIILTGGMSVDPDDLTPGAIKNSGARVVTYGAPVQPGNMFMMAYLNHTAILGVPGAAIYHKTTILDVVLPRIFAGEVLTKEDFVSMGEGGLCLGCETCRYPVCHFGRS